MLARYRRYVAAIGAVALVTGGLFVTSALAETPTPAPTGTPTAGNQQQSVQPKRYRDVFLGKLAAALGVTQDSLKSSITQASKDTIDEAVKDGNLTQEQGERLKQKADQNAPWFGFPMHRRGFGGPLREMGARIKVGSQAVMTAVAGKLGLTVDQLRTEMRSGKSLADVAKEKGVAEQDLRDAATAAVEAELKQAVTDGKLTQQQADRILEKMKNSPMLDFGLRMPKMGPRNGTPDAPSDSGAQSGNSGLRFGLGGSRF